MFFDTNKRDHIHRVDLDVDVNRSSDLFKPY